MPLSTTTKSFVEWVKLPYWRLPGLSTPKNNDIVVFNYPDGDTVVLGAQDRSYHQLVREHGYNNLRNPDFVLPGSNTEVGEISARPSDKREHYVKRCVAIAGDKFEVRDGMVYINDKLVPNPPDAQYFYYVKTSGSLFGNYGMDQNTGENSFVPNAKLLDKLDINIDETHLIDIQGDTMTYLLNMPLTVFNKAKNITGVMSVEKLVYPKGKFDLGIFPHKTTYPWNNDNFGPFLMPKAGATVQIDTANICLYDRIIDVYDNNTLEIKGAKIFINGVESTSYTFKQDYYFMMGDNRHNSADSRSWGVVPFDHVVGKPVFIWFSMKDKTKNPISGGSVVGSIFKNSKEGKFRWERFFCYVDDKGIHSFFWQTLAIIFGTWGLTRYLRLRKEKKSAVKKS